MSQFDVHRNLGRQRTTIPYVVIVQSSRFDRSRRRVVIPLVALQATGSAGKPPRSVLNGIFEVEGMAVALNPLEISSVALDSLGEKVASLAEDGDRIVQALDELFSRAWH